MCLQPKGTSRSGRVNTGFLPPRCFIAAAMDFAMMSSTERNGELIADFAAERR
jgi:hypothetical protein